MATRIIVVDEIDSTQDEARRRFGGSPILVVTHHQRRGRGRSGAAWQAAPRAVAASLAWRPGWSPEMLPRLTLVAGLAATDVVDVGLEWPNDLVVPAGKVGGILSEAGDEGVVVGLGLNLWWPDAPPGHAALHPDDPGPEVVEELAAAWAERLTARAEAGPEQWDRETYLVRCGQVGTAITWDPEGAGVVVDVAADGALVVATEHGEVHLRSGAVRNVG